MTKDDKFWPLRPKNGLGPLGPEVGVTTFSWADVPLKPPGPFLMAGGVDAGSRAVLLGREEKQGTSIIGSHCRMYTQVSSHAGTLKWSGPSGVNDLYWNVNADIVHALTKS